MHSCTLLASSILLGVTSKAAGPVIINPVKEYNYKNRFDYIHVEPLKNSQHPTNITIRVSFQGNLASPATIDIHIYNDIYMFKLDTLTVNRKENTLTYEYKNNYSPVSAGTTKFRFVLTSEFANQDVFIEAKRYEYTYMNVKDEEITYESPQNIAVLRYGQGVSYESEKFVFKKCTQELYLEQRKGFFLNNFTLNWTGPYLLPKKYSNPRLIIDTDPKYLNNCGISALNGYMRKLNLNVKPTTLLGTTFIIVNEEFYVHPVTLDISTTQKEGYVPTSYMFLPVNAKVGDTFTFRYMIDDIGANDWDFCYEFKVIIGDKLFGNCMDSSYCVSTEESTPDTSLGTRIVR